MKVVDPNQMRAQAKSKEALDRAPRLTDKQKMDIMFDAMMEAGIITPAIIEKHIQGGK